jgi:ribokinase
MIIVFGSLNVDMVMKIETMPHPGDTVLCPNYRLVPGGKGANQALAAAKAGAPVKLFGKVGQDDFGNVVLGALKTSSIDLQGVDSISEASTGCAMVCVDKAGENMIVVASGANLKAQEADIPNSLFSKETILLLQMETTAEENWKLIQRAKKQGARVLLNLAPAHPIPEDSLCSLDILILNQNEAALLALHLGFDVISPTAAARRIAATYGIICIVTLGKEGAIACCSEGTWVVKAMEIDPIDTTAAGDAFVGVLAASLDAGLTLPLALQRASVASGLTCLQAGAQSSLPSNLQIDANLKKIPLPRLMV